MMKNTMNYKLLEALMTFPLETEEELLYFLDLTGKVRETVVERLNTIKTKKMLRDA